MINPKIGKGLIDAGYVPMTKMGRIAGAAASAAQKGIGFAKDNKWAAAGIGLGAAGAGYGLYRMLSPNEYEPGPDYKQQRIVQDVQQRGQGYDTKPPQRPYSSPQPNVVRLPSMQEIELSQEDIAKAEIKQYREKEKNLKEAALADIYGRALPGDGYM